MKTKDQNTDVTTVLRSAAGVTVSVQSIRIHSKITHSLTFLSSFRSLKSHQFSSHSSFPLPTTLAEKFLSEDNQGSVQACQITNAYQIYQDALKYNADTRFARPAFGHLHS